MLITIIILNYIVATYTESQVHVVQISLHQLYKLVACQYAYGHIKTILVHRLVHPNYVLDFLKRQTYRIRFRASHPFIPATQMLIVT